MSTDSEINRLVELIHIRLRNATIPREVLRYKIKDRLAKHFNRRWETLDAETKLQLLESTYELSDPVFFSIFSIVRGLEDCYYRNDWYLMHNL